MHQYKESTESIFSPIHTDIVQKIKQDNLCLRSTFHINRNPNKVVVVVMSTHCIAICEHNGNDSNFLYYTPIEFDLKFEVLYEGVETQNNTQNSMFSKPIGFKLMKENTASIEFVIIQQNVLGIWLKYLTQLLNQIGFHKMFKPLRKLGKGGFATVYQVQRLSDNKLFAVKAFSKQSTLYSKNESHKLNLLKEIALLRQIENNNLSRLQGVYQSQNSLYVVLQLLKGGHLHGKINKRQGKFTISEIKEIILGLTRGLKELHQKKIMHRDIKPENIMLRNGLEPVLVDFGLACHTYDDDYIFYRCGTPGYVAPEVTRLEKGQKISEICDVFSVGVILHILLTAKPLFTGKKFEEVYQNNRSMNFNLRAPEYAMVDSQAMDLMSKMLKVNPNQRIRASEILKHPFLSSIMMDQQKPVTPVTKLTCLARNKSNFSNREGPLIIEKNFL